MTVPRPGGRLLLDTLLFAGLGVLLAYLGPYGTASAPTGTRLLYWPAALLGGGGMGSAIDQLLQRRVVGIWPRTALASLLMTPPVCALVLALGEILLPRTNRPAADLSFMFQVLAISALAMTIRALAFRRPKTLVKTETLLIQPLPEAERAFRTRLSAKRRSARLIAVEAEDHYLRVHTDAGPELISLTFALALQELAGADGVQVHRSWWIASEAIEGVAWRRGAGEARLTGGLLVPVSRSHAPKVRALGWR